MGVIKVIELVGNSTKSWEDAANQAVMTAAETIRGLTGADVVGMTAVVKDGKIVEYRATVKIAFMIERVKD
ncbi:MAG: dodecin family protein [Candidatus Hermodarchaeota archaeon]